MERKGNVLFYSSVADLNLFKITSFYKHDIEALILAGYNVRATNRISSFFLYWTYDISFLYFYKKSILPALISFLFFKKIYFTGGIDELSSNLISNNFKKGLNIILFKFCYFFSTKCNIVSNTDYANTASLLSVFPKFSLTKLSLFPHCIDVNFSGSTTFETKKNVFSTICWMGSVENVKRKGVDRCIFLFNELLKYKPDFKLFVIGTLGHGTEYLKDLADSLNISDSIIFTGQIDDAYKYSLLNDSKYYIQFSKYEGFGVAVLEAMLSNCIVLHTNEGGLKDTVGEKGIIFSDFSDYKLLLDKLLEVDNNYIHNSNLLFDNRSYIVSNYSIESRSRYFKSIIHE